MAFSSHTLDEIATKLRERGYAVLENTLPDELVRAGEAEILSDQVRFQIASIEKDRQHQERIRADRTAWWDLSAPTPVQVEFMRYWESLKEGMNTRLFLGLWDLEGHYAIYPPGAFYRTHLDRFQTDGRRVLSLVTFFNRDWSPDDGGELRIEGPEGEERVPPKAGTVVIFLSDEIPHEVLPTRRPRLSFAGWFRKRS